MRLGVAVFALLWATHAHADDVETIRTKDGSIYRGELVERVVDDHVTIKLATGEIKRIEWDNIAPEKRDPTPPPVHRIARAPSEGVEVSFEADDPRATLQRYEGGGSVDVDYVTPAGVTVTTNPAELSLFHNVCTAPCSETVDPHARYRVGGEGLVPSSSFKLPNGRASVITGAMSSSGKRTAGRVLTVYLGAPLSVIGTLLLVAAPVSSSTIPCVGCVNVQASLYLWSGIVLGLGVPMLIAGIVLWATSSSSVKIDGNNIALTAQGFRF